MKTLSTLGVALLAGCHVASAKEIVNPAKNEKYTSGEVHEALMAAKHVGDRPTINFRQLTPNGIKATWAAREAQGLMDSTIYASRDSAADAVPCVGGLAEVVPGDANNTFKCNNIDFYDFKSHADLGSAMGGGSSSWGWTSEDGREFVAVAQRDGAALAEINADGKLIYLGRLPQYPTANASLWREIRGYKNFLVIGSEAYYHGIQIFDMSKLLDVDPASPVTFNNEEDLTGYFNGLPVGRTHNVVINEEKQYAVAVGAQPRTHSCASGLIFIDLTDPSAPFSPGCAPGDGYVHDAQCLVYRGPDEQFDGRDICYGYNEDTLTIFDVTDKNTTNIISRTSYDGASYTHQGWVTDTQWQEFLVLDDEYDEYDKAGEGASGYPVTYFWDIRSLAAPKLTGLYRHPTKGIDHNQFVIDGYAYQSNYGSGLRIVDISSLPEDPTGANVSEAGYFDIYPEDDEAEGGGSVDFVGTWSHYPFFKSGHILVNTIERGAFVVKRTDI
ncbi:uncharacterized protein BCR38DRAFT_521564 [Pseudomassariella vexata]|uniref:Regulatory P domain-containing protein n=1 Tax=Pseudomassariella vexata TaxID=1141098 RepID=A0A1Y2EAC1_9PEZI|nr:uncharacterized protein BCR38DRAFT_521564 [Pseudomassariella vexata]ORY68513.1 hypothetical protein BCR38DRAFT_521564 [Pseudomassariella vexata]